MVYHVGPHVTVHAATSSTGHHVPPGHHVLARHLVLIWHAGIHHLMAVHAMVSGRVLVHELGVAGHLHLSHATAGPAYPVHAGTAHVGARHAVRHHLGVVGHSHTQRSSHAAVAHGSHPLLHVHDVL